MKDKTVLITGGTGSFGRTLASYLLSNDLCAKVIIFSRDEWKQWEMRNSAPIFDHPNIRYFLGDVRDLQRLSRALKGVDIVIHAAALKQVPAAEYNPSEFIKTNVMGAMNVIEAAVERECEKVIALSTDKACNPVNLYGATKLCSDKLFVAGNAYSGAKGTPRLSVVRYGNVLASRGSIVPFWQKLVAEGAQSIPITDERMTRFWITISQTVQFVVQILDQMRGGEIFVPKIASMRLVDLAEAIAPGIPHNICGIRPGEKIHETLIGVEDGRQTLEFHDHYVILPQVMISQWQAYPNTEGQPMPDGFSYTSDANTQWLNPEQLREIISAV
ncbi:MAG: UDP-N-acetylglucosamine 4,6-dehydratase (inverting) [Chlamydiales bacterium]|nr:UDP-N-acetylglucosamine 4,6-dehydratase (inverting) [Chlamydiales bacterium]